MTTMTSISAADVVRRILAGERDFASTRIAAADGDFAAQSDYAEMNRYLAGLTDLRDNPILLNGIDWSGVRAPGIYLLGAKMAGANFQGADLRDADLRRSDLSGANFRGANVSGSKITNAMFYRSDLRGIVGLDTTRDLGTCQFKHTMVTSKEKGIIEAALNARPLFEVRDE